MRKPIDDSIYVDGWEIFYDYYQQDWIVRDPNDRSFNSEKIHHFATMPLATDFASTTKLIGNTQ